jgi:Sigma-70 region 2
MSYIPRKHDGPAHAEGLGIENIDGLYGYAMALTRNHAEAEDLVQETYVRAVQAIGKLRSGHYGICLTILFKDMKRNLV